MNFAEGDCSSLEIYLFILVRSDSILMVKAVTITRLMSLSENVLPQEFRCGVVV